MAEIFGSAVASESVSRIFSIISGNPREHGSREDNAERLEFSVLKIHSVVAVSEDWQILHQPLLSWKARLKRAAKEGDGILRAHRRRSTTERQRDDGTAITSSSLQAISTARKRIARAARRFVPFGFGRGEGEGDDAADQISDSTVRRFERLAGVADEFFRYVQLGGRPRSLTMASSFKVPRGALLAGRTLEYSLRNGSKEALLLLHPFGGGEMFLFLSYEDTSSWQKNFMLSVMFLLDDHTVDILDIVMSSLELLPPQFGAACVTTREFARELLTQETSYSISPSSMSMWCIHASRRCYRDSVDKPSAATSAAKRQLSLSITRVDAGFFTLPPDCPSHTPADDDLPIRLVCHVDPHLAPRSYSEHYHQIELETLQELLPKVTEEGAHAREGNWWCPHTSTYLFVEPLSSVPPPTLQQMYLLENSERAV